MLVTMVATVWAASALAMGAPGIIVEPRVDSGAVMTTCPPWFGANTRMSQEQSFRKLVGANRHALRHYGVRELDFSVAARQVRVKFVVTGRARRKVVNREPCDTVHGHSAWNPCYVTFATLSTDLRRNSTAASLLLSETVESPNSLLAIAGVADPVQAASIEISKEGRAARVNKAPTQPSALESALHAGTHLLFQSGCSACVASRAKEDPHWRERRMRRRVGTTSYHLTLGSSAPIRLRENCAVPLYSVSRLWPGVCSSHEQAFSDCLIKAMVASVAIWSSLKNDEEPSCNSTQDDSETHVRRRRSYRTVLLQAMEATEWSPGGDGSRAMLGNHSRGSDSSVAWPSDLGLRHAASLLTRFQVKSSDSALRAA